MRPLLALLAAALLAGCKIEADFSDQLEVQTLVAEEYKYEIAAIDRLVFREEPLGAEGPKTLEALFDGVAKRVKAHGDTKFLKVESLELQLLAKRAGRLPADATGLSLQNDWMRIRNNLFDDRAWFARSSADLEAIAKEIPAEPPPEMKPIPTPAQAPAPAATPGPDIEKRYALTGKWTVVSMTADGEPRNDDELTGSIWTFEPPRLTMRSPRGVESTYNFTVDGDYLRVGTGTSEEGWMRYELSSGALRVAFFDGLMGKPKSFQHEPDPERKNPLLVVVQLAAVR